MGVEEAAHVRQDTAFHGVRPELPRHLELLVDVDGLADLDRAVGALRGVVQLTQRRVSGTRVVPRIATLGSGPPVQPLDEGDGPVGFHQLQQGGERGTHDARSHQHDVGFGYLRHVILDPSWHEFRISTAFECPGYPVCLERRRSVDTPAAGPRRGAVRLE